MLTRGSHPGEDQGECIDDGDERRSQSAVPGPDEQPPKGDEMRWYHIFLVPVLLTVGVSFLIVPGYLLQALCVLALGIPNSGTLEAICNFLGMSLGCGLLVYIMIKWYKRYGDRYDWL